MNNVEVDIDKIHELIFCFANGDFSKRLELSSNGDHTDTIISGINMLGEELEHSTVSKEYFRSIYNAISDMVIITSNQGLITNVNTATINSLGLEKESLIGKQIESIFKESKEFQEFGKFSNLKMSNISFETSNKINSINKHFLCTLSKIDSKFKTQDGILIIAKDITHEKNIEGEILNAIIGTEEKERRRIANDLHDALGQELNSVKMMFDSLLVMDKQSERFKEVLELCRNVINDSIDNTRSLSYDLMPKTLEDEKLFSAFVELEKNNRELLNISLILPDEEYEISKVLKINIFRIIQEFTTNTLKHSGANKLIIESFIENNKYFFSITDNGKGFDINKKSNGSGLKNIKSRLKVINALYVLTSSPKAGSKLIFTLSWEK